jgi:SAM-dependent methyltransferase
MSQTIDEGRLQQLLGQAVTDMGAAMNGALVSVGADLGFWSALRDAGPMTPADLARATHVPEPYANQWLAAQAASGYVDYDAAADTFTLSPEQAMAFAEPDSPVYLVGGYHVVGAAYRDRTRLAEAFMAGKGFGWHEHDPELFSGTEQFFRPGYKAHLLTEWLPALEGITDRLESGAKVADVGCGHGVSTALMAKEYPRSTFFGFDYHPESITRAGKLAAEEGASANTQFMTASATDYPGTDYDLICFFDCLHDMGDPVGALRHAREALRDDGTVMLVEPYANDSLKDNMNPVGRVFYAASTLICTPASLSQDVGLGLGAQAGEARLRAVAEQAGFTHFRRAAETPFNLVLEARR